MKIPRYSNNMLQYITSATRDFDSEFLLKINLLLTEKTDL